MKKEGPPPFLELTNYDFRCVWTSTPSSRRVTERVARLMVEWKCTKSVDDVQLSGVLADALEEDHPGDWFEYDVLIEFMRRCFADEDGKVRSYANLHEEMSKSRAKPKRKSRKKP